MLNSKNTKICLPAFNEEITLKPTIDHIKKYLPDYQIIVFDNGSTDKTSYIAKLHADQYYYVPKKGKGNVFKKIISETNDEFIIMTDADNTYDFSNISEIIKIFNDNQLNTLIGKRNYIKSKKINKFRFFSNKIFNFIFNLFFSSEFKDICSGFRVIRIKDFKDYKFQSNGFEIETELNILIAKRKLKYIEYNIDYIERSDSKSKLRSFIDGPKIIIFLIKKIIF